MGEGDLIVEEKFVLLVSPELVLELGDGVVEPVVLGGGDVGLLGREGGREGRRGEEEFVLLVSSELLVEPGDVVVEPVGFLVGVTEVCWGGREGGREG